MFSILLNHRLELIEQLLDTIAQLRDEIDQLKRENEVLRLRVAELEARLAQYDNAHTPPSQRRSGNRKNDQNEKGKPGQKKGHKGLSMCLAHLESTA